MILKQLDPILYENDKRIQFTALKMLETITILDD